VETAQHQYEIDTYMARAHDELEVVEDLIGDKHYATAISRAYYAVFYAASALLLTKGISRSKHSGVIAAFRQYFVKPSLIEVEYSRIYGDLLDARWASDYTLAAIADVEQALSYFHDASRFVERIQRYLEEHR